MYLGQGCPLHQGVWDKGVTDACPRFFRNLNLVSVIISLSLVQVSLPCIDIIIPVEFRWVKLSIYGRLWLSNTHGSLDDGNLLYRHSLLLRSVGSEVFRP